MRTRTKFIVAASALVLLGGLTAAGVSQADSRYGRHYGEHHGGYGMGQGGMGYGEHGPRHGMGPGMGRGGIGPGGMYGDDDHRPRMGRRMMHMFDTFDADGDGTLSQAEIDQARAQRLAAFDADGDGKLSLKEYEALWTDAMRERIVDRFQAHDDDGDGFVTAAEFGQPYDRMVARMDRNGDGVLSREDMGPRGRYRDDDDDD